MPRAQKESKARRLAREGYEHIERQARQRNNADVIESLVDGLLEGSRPASSGEAPGDMRPGGRTPAGGTATREPVAPQPGGDMLPASESRPALGRVASHFTKVPNALFDSTLRTLTVAEQSIYLQLYRLTYGYDRAECLVSLPKLAERCGIEQTSARRAVRRLEERGLILRVRVDSTHPDAERRGITFQLLLPADTPGVLPGGSESQAGRVSLPGRRAQGMKEIRKEQGESAPRHVLRSIEEQKGLARAVVYELRRDQPAATSTEIRAALSSWCDEQGVDPRFVDDAIGA